MASMIYMIFRQRKWRNWFKIIDVNHDGVLTSDDWTDAAETFIDGHCLSGQDAIKARAAMLDWGTLIFGLGLCGRHEMTEELFVRNLTTFYMQNPKYAEDVITEIYQKLVDISDQDKDGFITEHEFIVMQRAFGFEEEISRKLYKYIDESDNGRGIDNEAILDFWCEFVIGNDKKIYQRVVNMMENQD